MKKFLVRVNDQEFEVEVEELIQKEAKKAPISQSPAKHQVTRSGSGKMKHHACRREYIGSLRT